MKILVLGSGVIGVTSAYYLAKAGHEVVVVDRQSGPGLETSFANAGEISPSYASPWAAPGVPFKALKWLLMKHAPLKFGNGFDTSSAIWLARLLRNCTADRYQINKSRMLAIARHSRTELDRVSQECRIDYDQRALGTLQLFRSRSQLASARRDIDILAHHGIAFEILDRDGCLAAEPALSSAHGEITGGVRMPEDATGDCFKFTRQLAAECARLGVGFRYNTEVLSLRCDRDAIAAVVTANGELDADAYLVCAGSYSALLLQEIGLHIPVYPVKGYSLTAPIRCEDASPLSTVLDEGLKVAATRLGDRIRVGGLAEIAGFSSTITEPRKQTLLFALDALFPNAADLRNVSFWTGLRPMTPDGTPIIGATPIRGLYLNTGHGTLGWTMACGSASLIARLMSGLPTPIPSEDFSHQRYH